ncbi:STAS domain-containing protein [Cryobacterium sp. Hh11]|uniref:SulP family inorganic anion transporter n=1 Tax=Cryobacterium sp. Hh11 TaxID=2555868 RepID=UPI001069EC1B|nr:SulP family inorganic anion transporter [Cryobacterium sp. Hh11]TFD50138.1 STAS domain-containing protein [Cryobacterium sp. Hh11]
MPIGGFRGVAFSLVPGLNTALHYQRAWLMPDLRAGIVLSFLLIPAGMGYAEASGLPAHTGLYATIVPLLVYAVFGPSRILVLGPDSALAPIIAASILPLALGNTERAIALAGLLGLMVGVILLVAGVLRLGFVTDLLSKPTRAGYLNAVALLVIISQIPKLLGFSIDVPGPIQGMGAIMQGAAAGSIVVAAMLLGLASLAVIVGLRYLLGGRIPGVLIAVVASIVVTAIFSLQNVLPIVGAMPQGLPAPALGGLVWGDVVSLIGPALGIALIAFADTGVLSRTLAARRGDSVNGSQEMAGLGLANIGGGFFGGFPISASTSRTPVAAQAGARSQLTNVVGALIIVVFMLVAPGVTGYLPSATLSAVVIVAAASLVDVSGVSRLWRIDKTDALLSIAAFLGVFLVGVLHGILVAIGLSLVAFVIRAWRPYRAELGRIPGVRGYHDRSRHPDADRVPGIVIVRFDAPLFFANGGIFDDYVRSVVRRAERESEADGTPIHTVILAAEPITDIDTTAIDELLELDEYLASRGVTLVLAEMKGPVKDRLQAFGLGDRFPPERLAPTVGAAVDAASGELRDDIGGAI